MNRIKTISVVSFSLFHAAWLGILLTAPAGCKKQSDTSYQPSAVSPLSSTLAPLPTETILLAGQSFTVELAYKNHTRQQGLMYRKELAPNAGMLFLFASEKKRTFYMKNCLIDLDILFLRADGTIVKLDFMKVPRPGTSLTYYSSEFPAQYALELPAGTIERLGLKTGQKILFPPRILNILPDPD